MLFRSILAILLLLSCTGCATARSYFTFGSQVTRVEPIYVKAAIQDSVVSLGVPLVVEKRKTGGYRSPVEIHNEIRLSKVAPFATPVKPTGFVVGIKVRW